MNKKLKELVDEFLYSPMKAEDFAMKAYELGKKDKDKLYTFERLNPDSLYYFSIIKNDLYVDAVGKREYCTEEEAERIAQAYVDIMNGDA